MKDPLHLQRVERLRRFALMYDFEPEMLDLTLDDALGFLLQNPPQESTRKMHIRLREHLRQKVQRETEISLDDLVERHERRLNEIQEEYD
jgi:hypothetical protein